MLIAPSMICADFAKMGAEIKALDEAGADFLHWDVMDGQFVPNLTLGSQLIECVRPYSELLFAAHLMVLDPDRHVEPFILAGCGRITVHYEACGQIVRTVGLIRTFEDVKTGVAVNPGTPVALLDCVLDFTDVVTIMTVNPGYAGQTFLDPMLRKIEQLRRMIDARGLPTLIETDGGLCVENIAAIAAAGADIVVGGGSSVFANGHGYRANLEALRSAL
jgi:ribulose-phosphate 3-epimerase